MRPASRTWPRHLRTAVDAALLRWQPTPGRSRLDPALARGERAALRDADPSDPDRRILRMLGARGQNWQKRWAPGSKVETFWSVRRWR